MRVLAFLALLTACSRPSLSHEERFYAETATFERLREMIGSETSCPHVWIDHYEWFEPCNTGPCVGALTMPTGMPPGNVPRTCDWPNGCGRWVDETPTKGILASICKMPLARADEYLANMKRAGVLRVHRGIDEVSFPVEYQGLMISGTVTEIVWRATPPPSLRTGTTYKGSEYRALAPHWWLRREWN